MKIAVATEDGVTISQHFGRAPYYVVLTVEDGAVVAKETREKAAHQHAAGDVHLQVPGHDEGHDHTGSEAQARHASMAQSILDCEVVVARGMGGPAYQSLRDAGIRPVITTLQGVDEAVDAYLHGSLTDHPERLH